MRKSGFRLSLSCSNTEIWSSYAHVVGNLTTNFDYSTTIRSSYGPDGSDTPFDLVTLTFDLGGHGGG